MPKLYRNFKIYVKNHTQNAIQHTVTGFGISALLLEVAHLSEFFAHNKITGVLAMLLIALAPVLVDFLFFLYSYNNPIHELQYKLNTSIELLSKTKNNYRIKSAITRLNRELIHFNKMTKNNFILPALQNYEYIREVMKRILTEIMNSGDKYITISNLDFWTVKPREPMKFFDLNIKVQTTESKSIDRLVILDKAIKTPMDGDTININKNKDLKDLLSEFSKAKQHDENFLSSLKTLFFFDEDYNSHIKFLLSAFIISNDFKELMFVRINEWDERELKNPKIEVKYFSLNNFTMNPEEIKNTPKIINSLIKHIAYEITNNNGGKEYSEIYEYLLFYYECFSKMYDIYGSTYTTNKNLDLNKTDFFNLNMLKEFYKLN